VILLFQKQFQQKSIHVVVHAAMLRHLVDQGAVAKTTDHSQPLTDN